jgi:hypothetical protein
MSRIDLARVRFEQEQLRKLFDLPLVRFADDESWPSFGVQFRCDRYLVQAHFAPDHPLSPPRVQVHPAPESRHYYDDGRGCTCATCTPMSGGRRTAWQRSSASSGSFSRSTRLAARRADDAPHA